MLECYSGVQPCVSDLICDRVPFYSLSPGAPMKISISYRHVESPQAVESALNRHVSKIGKLLKCYEPDLVQFHGGFVKQPHRAEYSFSANLSLPTGTLHATGSGPNAAISARKAFVELETQIKRHQSRLRKDYEWKRKRGKAEQALA
jgi:ribosome-associated translation inhibitor RaiA